MLGLITITKKKSLEKKIVRMQQGDSVLLNKFINSYKPFVAKTVSSVCHRYIDEMDDEFSIGLIAFHDAIQKYSPERGASIFSFSEIIIRNRVIDYIRKQAKDQNNMVYLLKTTDEEDDFQGETLETNLSFREYKIKNTEEERREEIRNFSLTLSDSNLSFTDLVTESPKHYDARKNAIQIAKLIATDYELKAYLLEKKRLPIKQLESKVAVSRKTIERNRKYIIAMTLILIEDYYYLRDYIKGVLDE